MINDTWNVRSLYRGGSLTVVAGELARYKLDLVGVQEIRWVTVRIGKYNFFLWNRKRKSSIGKRIFFIPQNNISSYKVLKRIFGPERDEVTREWRKLHNEKRNNLHMGRGEAYKGFWWGNLYKGFWWGNLRERDHLGYPGVDGRIILRRIFRKWDVEDGLDRAGSG
jgi:hypothetical protein